MENKELDVARLWTIKDLEYFTQLSVPTLERYTASREIPSIKIGKSRRYIPKDVIAWLNKKRCGYGSDFGKYQRS